MLKHIARFFRAVWGLLIVCRLLGRIGNGIGLVFGWTGKE